jgi:arylsulfatase A-like enzyme
MTDQQHFRTLGCTGAKGARTPNIDRLASRGVSFVNHIVTNPVCSPSRASLMTGKYISEHGLWFNGIRLPEHHQTVAGAMSQAGWQTALFGKLHLVPIINRTEPHPCYGFETCMVAEGDQQLLDDEYFRWLRKQDPDMFVKYVNEMFQKGHADGYTSQLPEDRHLSTWITDQAIGWLSSARKKDQPFFLKVSYFDPHHAFNPCEPFAGMFADAGFDPPVYAEGEHDARPKAYSDFFAGCRSITRDAKRMAAIQRAYHAMVAHVDKCVGRLMDALAEQGLDRDTVVLFTSDHGELLGNHGLLWKGPFLLDDLVRVPMIASVPGAARRGQVCEDVTSGVDLMATILTASGAQAGPCESGLPMCDGDLSALPSGKRGYAIVEWEHPDTAKLNSSLRCIRTCDAKLVHYNRSSEGELYDLRSDPDEMVNRYGDSACEDIKRELFAKLAGHYLSYHPRVPYEGAW